MYAVSILKKWKKYFTCFSKIPHFSALESDYQIHSKVWSFVTCSHFKISNIYVMLIPQLLPFSQERIPSFLWSNNNFQPVFSTILAPLDLCLLTLCLLAFTWVSVPLYIWFKSSWAANYLTAVPFFFLIPLKALSTVVG